ncbi:cell division protein FtsA [candidate division KSB1 bacterium]|nr:cell division protein FtsA [candidate division KSB1 bacterium]
MTSQEMIVGLDIGTTKVGVVIGEADDHDGVSIVGVGMSPTKGLRRGVVVNIDRTVQSIETAIEEAERTAGVEINSVFAGIAGDHIRSINSRGVIAISRSDRDPAHNEISRDDQRRVIEAAKAVALPIDREVLHVLPQEYVVDDQDGIKDPVGLSGVRLEADVHIITGAVTSAQNILRCVRRAGVNVKELVLEPLASSYAVLGEDEKELGVALIDLGGGTTDIAIFFGGSIRYTVVVGFGGENITRDIALGLRTPMDQAETIKVEYGCALQSKVDEDEVITIAGVGGRPTREVSRHVLAAIIQPRVEEILEIALKELKKSDYFDLLTSGVVITGGSALLEGTAEVAENVFNLPVKIGVPRGIKGLKEAVQNPIFATGVGLVLYGKGHLGNGYPFQGDRGRFLGRIFKHMKTWFVNFF